MLDTVKGFKLEAQACVECSVKKSRCCPLVPEYRCQSPPLERRFRFVSEPELLGSISAPAESSSELLLALFFPVSGESPLKHRSWLDCPRISQGLKAGEAAGFPVG